MRVLEKLEPRSVFCFFEDLCRIPHGSGNTKAISDYCVRFAQERGLRCVQDAVNNIIIWKDGTPGYENAPTVILQGHLDMVAEKTPDSPIDFTKDPLDLQIDGDYVYAKGTTLGGDDGIAVAMALAVLDSKELPHPPIEAVFTIDEEVGMDGAAFLDPAPLQGRRLLNIDSEDEGILTVSCAGAAPGLGRRRSEGQRHPSLHNGAVRRPRGNGCRGGGRCVRSRAEKRILRLRSGCAPLRGALRQC